MLGDFFNRLTGQAAAQPTSGDERIALAALLVRVARANWDYNQAEKDRIELILSRRYGLDAQSSAKLRKTGEDVEARAADTVRFTREIKDAVDLEDRDTIIEALWELVLADGVRDAEEEGALRLIAPLLGISDRDSALARQRIEERMKAEDPSL